MPSILVNLISTTRLKKKGLFYYIKKDYLYTRVYNEKRVLADIIERNNLLQLRVVNTIALAVLRVVLTELALYLLKTVILSALAEV